MPQVYPPENGQGPPSGNRWYIDDVTGLMHPESEMTRDEDDRLRWVHDLYEPDREEILEHWTFPTEENPPEP